MLGKSSPTLLSILGNMLEGIISPPNIMEGKKISWDHSTVERESDEITPMSTPIPAQVKAVSKRTRTKPAQLTGDGAPKNRDAVVVIIAATTIICKMVVSAGMVRIETAQS